MNRPEAKYYEPSVDEFAFEHYVEDLEKYCDELEKELKFIEEVQTPDYEKVQEELWKYQKALEKACFWVVFYQTETVKWNEDKWKEFCLKDD